MMLPVIDELLNSDDPVVRWMALNRLAGGAIQLEAYNEARLAMVESPTVNKLLSILNQPDDIFHHPYFKWSGGHWVLAMLAEIGYPPGDSRLIPLRDQQLDWLFSEKHGRHIKTINGRVRRCASQEGNALWSQVSLGIADSRADLLAQHLMEWQWEDGGWNCDRHPDVKISSFMESLIPMRALALYARVANNWEARDAAIRASEIFFSRRMFRRRQDGAIMDPDFIRLHYPCYWHYDILFGLKVIAEMDLISNPRYEEALDLLEAKMLPGGGFPSEGKYYRTSRPDLSGYSPVAWGPVSKRNINPFVTLDALWVLTRAGRKLAQIPNDM